MLDDLQRLRDNTNLFDLLAHYAELAAADRQVWQDRRMQQNGCATREMMQMHGELLAYGWVEQNTGVTPALRKGEAPGCYRITPAGLRALKTIGAGEEE